MSRNIKEIGKELLGKSLNSFHRKTGLTQLEKNNEMQDGILDGILSQVDDAYIEKTEQSNVIHLDGSGDGVVVLDSIEGNTMVNILGDGFNTPSNYVNNDWGSHNSLTFDGDWVTVNSTHEWSGLTRSSNTMPLKPNTTYTLIVEVRENTLSIPYQILHASNNIFTQNNTSLDVGFVGIKKFLFTTQNDLNDKKLFQAISGSLSTNTTDKIVYRQVLLEGDWRNKEVPYFNSLQSSFEEEVEEDKYKIEILSNNRNLVKNTDFKANSNGIVTHKASGEINVKSTVNTGGVTYKTDRFKVGKEITFKSRIRVNSTVNGTSCTLRIFNDTTKTWIHAGNNGVTSDCSLNTIGEKTLKLKVNLTESNYKNGDVLLFYVSLGMNTTNDHSIDFDILKDGVSIELGNTINSEILPHKQNKIKLLINEPLRSVHNVKDRLCIKDNKLVVERNVSGEVFDGTEDLWLSKLTDSTINVGYGVSSVLTEGSLILHKCDRLPNVGHNQWDKPTIGTHCKTTNIFFNIPLNWLGGNTINDVKQYLVNQYNQGTPMKIVHILNEPIYEEVLNEYGEPILLEGYENGTIYIDSTIVPTTTVRYTPKMESFKTLNEVSDNNTMLANDINDNIIPYMMDVDFMIMEKEMALMSHKNIRKMEVLDMTSMQKRTQDMLERLIKGKTLTEQECKTRITTYLHAGKITDAQAKELNFLIDEIYA